MALDPVTAVGRFMRYTGYQFDPEAKAHTAQNIEKRMVSGGDCNSSQPLAPHLDHDGEESK